MNAPDEMLASRGSEFKVSLPIIIKSIYLINYSSEPRSLSETKGRYLT